MKIDKTVLGYFKIATVSPKVYVGEVFKNVAIHKQAIKQILDAEPDVKLIVFPEFSLTGYTCGDLFLSDNLIQNVKDGIHNLKVFSESIKATIIC